MQRMTPKERQLARLVTAADQDLKAAEAAMPATRGDIALLRDVLVDIRDLLKDGNRIAMSEQIERATRVRVLA